MGRVRLDHPGVEAVLKSAEVAAEVARLAEEVAAHARGSDAFRRHEVEVEVERYTTDRAAAAVVAKHPAARGIEAKHGTLVRAARAAGLEVRGRE